MFFYLLKLSAISIVCSFLALPAYSMGSKVEVVPLKPRKLSIVNGEMLKYTHYTQGEKYKSFFVVSIIDTNKNFVYLYLEDEPDKPGQKLPDSYTNFSELLKISIDEGSLSEVHADWISNTITNNWTGTAAVDYLVDRKASLLVHTAKIWDGFEMKTMVSKVRIKPGFSVWNINSLMYAVPRFLDLSKPGIFYVVEPQGSKEAVPAYFVYQGRETVETKAGKFNTVKLGFGVGDPFLAQLFSSYIKEWHFWVEESERCLLIKADTQFGVYQLEDIGRWKE